MNPHETQSATDEWLDLLQDVLLNGQHTVPRGMGTAELLAHRLAINPMFPAVCIRERKLSYRFMAAEARWILRQDDKVEPLAKHVARMRDFSDDGETLAGAYGPRLMPQLPYVIETLKNDPCSRQAVATIWTPTPSPSRDIPCTVDMQFLIRQGRLTTIVHMRSSDAWLGVPYDVFSFTMIAWRVALQLGITPGSLYLLLGSSHLYDTDKRSAMSCSIKRRGHSCGEIYFRSLAEQDLFLLKMEAGGWRP